MKTSSVGHPGIQYFSPIFVYNRGDQRLFGNIESAIFPQILPRRSSGFDTLNIYICSLIVPSYTPIARKLNKRQRVTTSHENVIYFSRLFFSIFITFPIAYNFLNQTSTSQCEPPNCSHSSRLSSNLRIFEFPAGLIELSSSENVIYFVLVFFPSIFTTYSVAYNFLIAFISFLIRQPHLSVNHRTVRIDLGYPPM